MSTGFTFGAKTTAPPTFGTGSITFGTPASQPAQQFGFGTPAPASSTPNLFGTQTPSTSTLGFGTPASVSSAGGYSFGASTPAFGSTAPTTGFSFGAPASTAPTTGFAFGTPTTTSAGLSFGPPASSATSLGLKPPGATGLSFGTPATTTAGLSFGAPASTGSGLSFGPLGSTGLSFGTTTSAPSTGLAFGAQTSTPATGFSFGAAITSAPTLGLSFGTTTTSTPSLSFGPTTTAPSLGLGGLATSSTTLTLTPTTTQQNVGLGGVAFTLSKSGTSSTAQKELPLREQLLPNELTQLVEQFKNVVQEEKNRSSDVARSSVKEFRKVEIDLDSVNHQFNQFENQLLVNRNLAEKLKYDTAKGLQNIEIAQRTQDTPPSLQYDNTAPLQFFLDLADSFEKELQILKLKIDNTEKYVKKSHDSNALTSQDLTVGLKRLHETFVALAGRMQTVHSQVEAQKEQFLHVRRQVLKDTGNPFEKQDRNAEARNIAMRNAMKVMPPSLASGPTPFNNIALSSNLTAAAQQNQTTAFPTATTTITGLGFGLANTAPVFGAPSTNNSLFKPTGFGTSPFQLNASTNFQLQKPPTGNKRGKQ